MRLLKDLKRQRRAEQRKDLVKKVGLGTFIGGVLGSAAGLLFAPDSGENTRKKIKEGANEVKENVEKNLEKTKADIEKAVEEKKVELQNTVQKIKEAAKDSKDEVASAVDEVAQEIKAVKNTNK